MCFDKYLWMGYGAVLRKQNANRFHFSINTSKFPYHVRISYFFIYIYVDKLDKVITYHSRTLICLVRFLLLYLILLGGVGWFERYKWFIFNLLFIWRRWHNCHYRKLNHHFRALTRYIYDLYKRAHISYS